MSELAIKQANLENRFIQFIKNDGFIKVRPILYVKASMSIDLLALLNSTPNNLPLGSVVCGKKVLGFTSSLDWNWSLLPAVNLKQLAGVWAVYLYTKSCAYNAGRKVYPAEKQNGKVKKWSHALVAGMTFLPYLDHCLRFEFSHSDILAIQLAVNACCKVNVLSAIELEPITASSYLRRCSDYPNWIMGLLNKELVNAAANKKGIITDWLKVRYLMNLAMKTSNLPLSSTLDKLNSGFLGELLSRQAIFDLILNNLDRNVGDFDWYKLVAGFMGHSFIRSVVQSEWNVWYSGLNRENGYLSSPEYICQLSRFERLQYALDKYIAPDAFSNFKNEIERTKRHSELPVLSACFSLEESQDCLAA